jgi:hypothetical protein
VGNTVIENYEPDDSAWGVVIGPFMRPKPEDEHDDVVDSGDDAEDQRSQT